MALNDAGKLQIERKDVRKNTISSAQNYAIFLVGLLSYFTQTPMDAHLLWKKLILHENELLALENSSGNIWGTKTYWYGTD